MLLSAVLRRRDDRAAGAAAGPPGTRLLAAGAVVTVVVRLGRGPVALHAPRDAHVLPGGRRRDHPLLGGRVFGMALVVVVPLLALLFRLDQRSRLEEA